MIWLHDGTIISDCSDLFVPRSITDPGHCARVTSPGTFALEGLGSRRCRPAKHRLVSGLVSWSTQDKKGRIHCRTPWATEAAKPAVDPALDGTGVDLILGIMKNNSMIPWVPNSEK